MAAPCPYKPAGCGGQGRESPLSGPLVVVGVIHAARRPIARPALVPEGGAYRVCGAGGGQGSALPLLNRRYGCRVLWGLQQQVSDEGPVI